MNQPLSPCIHARPCPPDAPCHPEACECAAGHFFRPHVSVCLSVCHHYDGPPQSQRSTPPLRPAQPCQGCGGAKYRPQDFNRPGGQDELAIQLG